MTNLNNIRLYPINFAEQTKKDEPKEEESKEEDAKKPTPSPAPAPKPCPGTWHGHDFDMFKIHGVPLMMCGWCGEIK